MEEAPHIEGYMNKNIHDNYNLTPKTLIIDYADMLLPITKYIEGRNEFCTIKNMNNGTI